MVEEKPEKYLDKHTHPGQSPTPVTVNSIKFSTCESWSRTHICKSRALNTSEFGVVRYSVGHDTEAN